LESAQKKIIKIAKNVGFSMGSVNFVQMLLYALALGTGSYLVINEVEVNGEVYTAGRVIGIFFLVITASSNIG
jgi:hypothetical protein